MVSNPRNRCRWGLYYDGDCGFCDRVKRWLSGICFFDVIEWTPYQALERLPPGLAWDGLERAVYLDPGQNRLYEWFYDFKLLPLIPLVPIMWFHDMNLAGEEIYSWVGRDRYCLSVCRRVRE